MTLTLGAAPVQETGAIFYGEEIHAVVFSQHYEITRSRFVNTARVYELSNVLAESRF